MMFRRTCQLLSSSSGGSKRPVTTVDIHAAYRVLGLPVGASPDAARQQYLKLARLYHPDVSNGDESRMKAVNTAYEVVQAHGPELRRSRTTSAAAMQQQQQQQQRHQHAAKKRRDRGGGSAEQQEDGFGGDDNDDADPTTHHRSSNRTKKRPSAMGKASSSWNERPEFEWTSDIFSVANEADAAHPRNHPLTVNKFFSLEDDSAIFQAVRSGANVEEIARTMGRTPHAIEARMNSTQFKLRVQRLMRAGQLQSAREDYKNWRSGSPTSDMTIVETMAESKNDHDDDHGTRRNHQRRNTKLDSKKQHSRRVFPFRDTVYRSPERIAAETHMMDHPGDLPFLHPEEVVGGGIGGSDIGREFSVKNIASAEGRSYANLQRYMSRRRRN